MSPFQQQEAFQKQLMRLLAKLCWEIVISIVMMIHLKQVTGEYYWQLAFSLQ